MIAAVLDTSALLAMLLAERGSERIEALLPQSAMSAVNLAETAAYLARQGATRDQIEARLQPLFLTLFDFDRELAIQTGLLLPITKPFGLSLGDRACLALARKLGVAAITADRAWLRAAAAVQVHVVCIR
ncbi:MAG: type II toxin-antitoxin system VapC family toxin [Acetobacteraceae bacterium]